MTNCSILITCFNLGAFVEEALNSALAQTYPNFEVVLVDDGSTDAATIAMLDCLPTHPRLRILRTENQGVARARNYGIQQSKGKYILPLDADDRILPTYLERAVKILEARPEVGFVGCHYHSFGERSNEYRPIAYRLPDLLIENVVPIASVYRRQCWEHVGGYCPELNSIEDWDLWIGILEAGWQAAVIPDILFEYRVRPNSNLSHLRKPDTYVERLKLLYQRHPKAFTEHLHSVIAGKDRQFAELHSWALYLEQQAKNWERVAEERLEIINTISISAGRSDQLRNWIQHLRLRWQYVCTEHQTGRGRMRAIGTAIQRAVRHQLRILFKN